MDSEHSHIDVTQYNMPIPKIEVPPGSSQFASICLICGYGHPNNDMNNFDEIPILVHYLVAHENEIKHLYMTPESIKR